MAEKLSNPEIRRLKAEAQRLKSTFKIGKHGLSQEFIRSLDIAFQHHELIKVKFDEFKDQKDILAVQLAEKTSSHLIWRIGNVAVLYRRKIADPKSPAPGAPTRP